MRLSRSVTFALACLAAACTQDVNLPTAGPSANQAAATAGDRIPGRYIVVFHNDVKDVAQAASRIASASGASIQHIYTGALRGMAVSIPDAAAAALERNPEVAFVEQDQRVPLNQPAGSLGAYLSVAGSQTVGVPWQLDRIDQRARPLNGTFNYSGDGSGVTIYFINAGSPRLTHSEFGGRLSIGLNQSGVPPEQCIRDGATFTAAAGIGATVGSARGARGVAVILSCDGSPTSSSVLAAFDWLTANAVRPAVIDNHVVSNVVSQSYRTAIQNSVASGLTWVGSTAGGGAVDACTTFPAGVPDLFATAASDINDAWNTGIGYGPCVDIITPSLGAVSATAESDESYGSGLSGAGMAMAAGVAAQYLGANPGSTPGTIMAALIGNATTGAVSGAPAGTPNRLLYNGGTSPLVKPATAAAFNYTCSGISCTFYASSSVNAVTSSWAFGDNTSGAGVSVTHTFPKPGGKATKYTVTLTITDAVGTRVTASAVVTCASTSCS
jgi:hypothetical protein